ncbi:hypothetical protein DERP_005222 [Dermatophagoides pteronyssinus]|uniref:Uncharacterized protein n=1 Tax=Dermatophagoides pteronyssinus TaxID=6956 RepID=A0ABQ8JMI7_DERPT|nr:hypothetical protein DERP_005222 [Dermatophagoides pteronyssinus]
MQYYLINLPFMIQIFVNNFFKERNSDNQNSVRFKVSLQSWRSSDKQPRTKTEKNMNEPPNADVQYNGS